MNAIAVIILVAACAWITHVVWVIKLLLLPLANVALLQLVLAFFGVTFPPIGIIHGIMIWFTGF